MDLKELLKSLKHIFVLYGFTVEEKAVCSCIGYNEGLAQDCSNSIANALELLQSCT